MKQIPLFKVFMPETIVPLLQETLYSDSMLSAVAKAVAEVPLPSDSGF